MTAKEYLTRLRHINQRLNIMSEQIGSLRDSAERITPTLSNMPKAKNHGVSMVEEAVVRIVDLETDMKKYVAQIAEIHRVIHDVKDPVLYAILVKRYVSGCGWYEIADDLGVSYRHVCRLHSMALGEIERTMRKWHIMS